MTRAYIPIREFEAAFEPALELYDNKKIIEGMIKEAYTRRDNAPFRCASRLVRYFAGEFINVQKMLVECGYKEKIARIPLIIPNPKDPKTFHVFSNIVLNNSKYKNENYLRELDVLANISWVILHEPLTDFMESVDADMKDENKNKKWATFNRTWRQIKRYETMTAARVLTRVLNMKGEDHVIRDLAERIDAYRKPLELEWAEKPEDFMIMYGEGPQSCMTEKGAGESRSWIWLRDKYKHMPTSFFAYHPSTRGVFVRKGTSVVCRAITYRLKDVKGKPKYAFGRCYSTNNETLSKFKEMLTSIGYIDGSGTSFSHDQLYHSDGFTIPGLPIPGIEGAFGCPQPHQDNIPYYYVEYDKKANNFVFSPKQTEHSISASVGTRGYIDSRTCNVLPCTHCKKKLHAKNMILSSVDDKAFCSEDHMYKAGYCQARRGNGEVVFMPQADAIKDVNQHHVYYTNREAALKHSAVPVINELGEITENVEDLPISAHANIAIVIGSHETDRQVVYAQHSLIRGGYDKFCADIKALGAVSVSTMRSPVPLEHRVEQIWVLNTGVVDTKHINIKAVSSFVLEEEDETAAA